MNKEQVQELLVGAAVVALGYALYKHFGARGAGVGGASAGFAAVNPIKPNTGVPYDTANPGAFIKLADLLNGAIHDVITGDRAGETFASIEEINRSALGSYYGTDGYTFNEQRGYVSQDSVVRLPGALW